LFNILLPITAVTAYSSLHN